MLRFVPLTFLCGADGFAIFLPYIAVFMTALHLLRWMQSMQESV